MNSFKTHNRFSSLMDDRDLTAATNNRKPNTPPVEEKRISQFRPYDEKDRARHRAERANAEKALLEREKERHKQSMLSANNFPELCGVAPAVPQSSLHFLDTVSASALAVQPDDARTDDLLVAPGWVLLDKNGPRQMHRLVKTDAPFAEEVVVALARLHEARTSRFIALNDYDTWEHLFKCRDWREREAYLDELSDDSDFGEYEIDGDDDELV